MCDTAVSSICSVRERIGRHVAAAERDVIVLAVDGIPLDLGRASWTHAVVTPLRTVFPSTSSSAWLSSVTGHDVASHGIPGVVFEAGDALINVFEYRGELAVPDRGNIFTDCAAAGYDPLFILGDLDSYDCTWRTALTRGSRLLPGHRFYTSGASPAEIRAAVRASILAALAMPSARPRLVWCHIDADRAIHYNGYDAAAQALLRFIDDLAIELTARGAVAIAFSDHGLVPTRHEPELAEAVERIAAEHGGAVGGAGRTRWIYSRPRDAEHVITALKRSFPATVRIAPADEFFEPGSLARARVGDVLLIAEGESFLTFDGQTFEHGSRTDDELLVPFAEWGR